MSTKYLYLFTEGNADMRELLGGKGANLAEMTNLGMPVPQGFTITTEACNRYYDDGRTIAPEIESDIIAYMAKLEEITGKKFGDAENPLLVSVRSGARASMPGMMDTILNLGINDTVAEGMIALTDNPRFVYDSYRRFIQMFSDVVMELPKSDFEKYIDQVKARTRRKRRCQPRHRGYEASRRTFQGILQRKDGRRFPSGSERTAYGSRQGGIPQLGQSESQRLQKDERYSAAAGERQSMSSPWYSETWGMIPVPAWRLRGIRLPGERDLFGEFLMNGAG